MSGLPNPICEVCGKRRGPYADHRKCSRELQRRRRESEKKKGEKK